MTSNRSEMVERVRAMLLEWERHREILNMIPAERERFIGRHTAAIAAIPSAGGVEELREWALERSAVFHRLAHEDEHLRTQYIASSTAYRELAFEIANRATLNNTSPKGESHE